MKVVINAACVLLLSVGITHAQSPNGIHWVSAWSTAVQTPRPMGPAGKAPPEFENQTIRMVVRMTLGGERLRVRFSNEFGTAPLSVGAAHVALVRKDGTINPETDRALTFNGD